MLLYATDAEITKQWTVPAAVLTEPILFYENNLPDFMIAVILNISGLDNKNSVSNFHARIRFSSI